MGKTNVMRKLGESCCEVTGQCTGEIQFFLTLGDSCAKVAAQLRVYAQEKSYCFQTLCESCTKVANGVDLLFAPQQHVKDNNGATLFSMSERRYFEKMFCYLREWKWMFSNEWKAY